MASVGSRHVRRLRRGRWPADVGAEDLFPTHGLRRHAAHLTRRHVGCSTFNDECGAPLPRRSSGAMNECPSTGESDGDALSVLRAAVRHAPRGRAGSVQIAGNARFPVNKGGLCVKGWSAAGTLAHRTVCSTRWCAIAAARCVPATWDGALESSRPVRIQRVQARHGADAVGVFGSGALTNEKAYLLGKFARVALGTSNIDYNGRFCMSSARGRGDAGVRARPRPAVPARGHRAAPTSCCSSAPTPPRRCRR